MKPERKRVCRDFIENFTDSLKLLCAKADVFNRVMNKLFSVAMKEVLHPLTVWLLLTIFAFQRTTTISLEGVDSGNHEISYRLPQTIYPVSYRVDIITNLADLNANFTFEGTVWITVHVYEPTNKIILHSKNLDIDEQEVGVFRDENSKSKTKDSTKDSPAQRICENSCEGYEKIQVVNQCYHDDYELYVITVAQVLDPRFVYVIYIPYRGELTQGLAGYYRSSYKDLKTGETKWIAVTQFESTDARRALPCFDEPAFKASFQVNLAHSAHRTSISNMPKIKTSPMENMKDWVWDQYEYSYPMSTYLLAFVVSDFSYKISPPANNGVLFRVWARKDAINQVDYASVIGPRVLEYFENYFSVAYPLPKLDMIAIPDFSAGAMENWGLITYREVALLYDPKISSASSQPYVASVVAHEIAHQWFGNLVTMKWWTDLWLNEGFATYVSALGVQHLHPEWHYYAEEIVDNVISVLSLDSLRSSHPISVPIGHPREIAQIFDTISYKKGFYVLRMMNLFLGEETFTKGVSNYLHKNAYANAEQDDLWKSLTEQAHSSGVLPRFMSVKEIMDSWTLQTGYPLITIERNYQECSAVISQERFLADKVTNVNADGESKVETLWWVPLRYTWESERNFNETRPQLWLTPKQNSMTASGLPCEDWILFNIQISGLYRVKYDLENWNRLSNALKINPKSIAILNKVQLIDDSMELAKIGDIPYEVAFGILKYLEAENEYLTWKTGLRNLGYVDRMLRYMPTYGHFRAFVQKLLREIYFDVSSQNYENVPENLKKIKLQSLIAGWACKFEVGDCKETAISIFSAWMKKANPDTENPIPKDHRSHIYCTAIKFGGEKEWNFLWQRYLNSNVGNEKNSILSSLTCTREIWLLNRYLEWSIDEKSGIRKQDSASVFAGIARGNIGYFLAKNFLQNRIADIYTFYGPNSIRLGTWISVLANQITTSSDYLDLENFVMKNEDRLRSGMQAVKQGLENAKVNVMWQSKFYKGVSQYFMHDTMKATAVKANN